MTSASFVIALSTLNACAPLPATRYSVNANTVVALREFSPKVVSVGPFTATEAGDNEMACRAGFIGTPDEQPFSDYIRGALMSELKNAGAYAVSAPIVITGDLTNLDFSSNSGRWTIGLTLKSSNGHSLTRTEVYEIRPVSWVRSRARTGARPSCLPSRTSSSYSFATAPFKS